MTFKSLDHSSPVDVNITLPKDWTPKFDMPPGSSERDYTKLRAHVEMLHAEIFQLKELQKPICEFYEPTPAMPFQFNYEWLTQQLSDFKGIFGELRTERESYVKVIQDLMQAASEHSADVYVEVQKRHPVALVSMSLSAVSLLTIACLLVIQYLHI